MEPEKCLAFEDSPTGISSAVDAGCQVVVVAANVNAHLKAKESPGILMRVDDFAGLDVPRLISAEDEFGI